MKAITKIRVERGCGFRKKGGYYFVAGKLNAPCGKLPLELDTCPTCGGGFPFSMAPKWVDVGKLFEGRACLWLGADDTAPKEDCVGCPLDNPADLGKALLIWVGKKHYDTAEDYLKEARRLGISRRIRGVPKDFELGKHWVLLAHLKAFLKDLPDDAPNDPDCPYPGQTWGQGIFSIFKPTDIEYLVKDTDTDDFLSNLIDRGVTPVVEVDQPNAAVVRDRVRELVAGLASLTDLSPNEGGEVSHIERQKASDALRAIANLTGRLGLCHIDSIANAPPDKVYQIVRWLDAHYERVYGYHWTDADPGPSAVEDKVEGSGQGQKSSGAASDEATGAEPTGSAPTSGVDVELDVVCPHFSPGMGEEPGECILNGQPCIIRPKSGGPTQFEGCVVKKATDAAKQAAKDATPEALGTLTTPSIWDDAKFAPADLVSLVRSDMDVVGMVQNACAWSHRSPTEAIRSYRLYAQKNGGDFVITWADEDNLIAVDTYPKFARGDLVQTKEGWTGRVEKVRWAVETRAHHESRSYWVVYIWPSGAGDRRYGIAFNFDEADLTMAEKEVAKETV